MGRWRLRGGDRRSVNEVERVEEGERREVGHVDQCCRRIDLLHGSNCMNLFTLCSPECRASVASRALWVLADPRIRVSCQLKVWPVSTQRSARHEFISCRLTGPRCSLSPVPRRRPICPTRAWDMIGWLCVGVGLGRGP